ncbi:hypothetical protein ACFV3E_40725 [Streptomyces sp. NPDC059718]
MALNPDEIAKRFAPAPDDAERIAKKNEISCAAHALAALINELVPGSREESEAVTHVETAVMWAHAAIDRRYVPRQH